MRRRFALSHPCDRPSVRGASDCLLQRPGVGGHKGVSMGGAMGLIFDRALSLALDAVEWLIEHSSSAERAILTQVREALSMSVPWDKTP